MEGDGDGEGEGEIGSSPAKSHGISVSLQKWSTISRSHGNATKSHGI